MRSGDGAGKKGYVTTTAVEPPGKKLFLEIAILSLVLHIKPMPCACDTSFMGRLSFTLEAL